MNRITKALIVGVVLIASSLLLVPAASACCIPCQGFCTQRGVPPTAYCCTGIPEPNNACGFTICGKWLQGQKEPSIESEAAAFLEPTETPAQGCEQVFPWLAEADATPAL